MQLKVIKHMKKLINQLLGWEHSLLRVKYKLLEIYQIVIIMFSYMQFWSILVKLLFVLNIKLGRTVWKTSSQKTKALNRKSYTCMHVHFKPFHTVKRSKQSKAQPKLNCVM